MFALASALVVAVVALCRERRLRQALARLLNPLLARWRAHEFPPKKASTSVDSTDRHDGVSRRL